MLRSLLYILLFQNIWQISCNLVDHSETLGTMKIKSLYIPKTISIGPSHNNYDNII